MRPPRFLLSLCTLGLGLACGQSNPGPNDGGDSGVVPDAGPVPWSVTGWKVVGNGDSRELRQGAGMFTLQLEGTNLLTVDTYQLDQTFTAVASATGTEVLLNGTLAHGESLGAHGLVMTGHGVSQVLPAAITVTAITASTAAGASDSAGRGTTDAPFRTLTFALSLAGAGDTVSLGAGTYSDSAGETWRGPETMGVNPMLAASVPSGVLIAGAGDSTVLESSADGGNAHTGLVFGGDGGVQNLHLQNFDRAIIVKGGHVSIDHVTVQAGANDGLLVANSEVTVNGGQFSGSPASGVATFTGTASFNGTTFTGNRTGVYGYASTTTLIDAVVSNNGVLGTSLQGGLFTIAGGTVNASHSTFENNSLVGIYLSDGTAATVDSCNVASNAGPVSAMASGAVQVHGQAMLQLINSSVHDNVNAGLVGPDFTGSITIAGGSFNNNGVDVKIGSAAPYRITARNVTMTGSAYVFQLGGGYQLDLGTQAEQGGNTLNASVYCLYLAATLPAAASCSHTTLNGMTPIAQPILGPVDMSPVWYLKAVGDNLTFY